MPKTGARRLVVDGIAYRWRVRRRATNLQADYGRGMLHIAVERADAPGAVLVLDSARPHPADCSTRQTVPVRPSDVAEWVRLAVRAGWSPAADGPRSHARVVGSAVEANVPR